MWNYQQMGFNGLQALITENPVGPKKPEDKGVNGGFTNELKEIQQKAVENPSSS